MRWHQLAEMASGAYLHHPINQLIACATSSPSIVALPCSLPRRSVPAPILQIAMFGLENCDGELVNRCYDTDRGGAYIQIPGDVLSCSNYLIVFIELLKTHCLRMDLKRLFRIRLHWGFRDV
jgi:hypothetical protein